jgi:hypothetical protein
MARAAAGSIVRQIEALFEVGSIAGLTDWQLLERFTARRDAVSKASTVHSFASGPSATRKQVHGKLNRECRERQPIPR